MKPQKVWKIRMLRAICLLRANGHEEDIILAKKIQKSMYLRNWEEQRDYWEPWLAAIEHNAATVRSANTEK